MTQYDINKLQHEYLPGTRIQKVDIDNKNLPKDSEPQKGTVDLVDDIGLIFVNWDNGENSVLNPEKDQFKRLSIDDQIQEADNKRIKQIEEKQRARGRKNRKEKDYEDKERD